MDTNRNNSSQTDDKDKGYSKSNAPSLTLPKGGGAMKGIDEKFQVNAVNGTSGMNIPLPFGKTRSEFSPSLSIGYNSGGGNSEFGLGWSLSLASISRKTDKRLPLYEDHLDSDVFLFAGAEDLVPELDATMQVVTTQVGLYKITKYRPRIEGLFARFEKIQEQGKSYFYWKVTTKDNITTFFGSRASSRIADPDFENRVYRWLPDMSYDDKGNVHLYEYKAENLVNVPKSASEVHRHKGYQKFTNVYLKSVHYGNHKPFYEMTTGAYKPDIVAVYGTVQKFFYTAVIDYGEHDASNPSLAETQTWKFRKDAFSQYHAGFEIRTYRLGKRVLFFSHFSELGTTPCLTHSIDFAYKYEQATAAFLETDYIVEIRHRAYRKKTSGTGYDSQSLPPIALQYQEPEWHTDIQHVSPEALSQAPIGLVSPYQWVDYYGEGISGILSEQAEGWYYKSNLGNGEFSPAEKIAHKPNLMGLNRGNLQLQDLEANGKKYLVSTGAGLQGFFEMDRDERWKDFVPFQNWAQVNFNDPNTRMLDLTGDGMPDILITQENAFLWYEADGRRGYKPAQKALKAIDEHRGVSVVFSDALQRIFLADMSGDGMSDIVQISNGSISYWPNLGYGRFGAKVTMDAAPHFDHPSQYHPKHIHLADISGTGASDIIYTGQDRFRAWLNLSGNSWSEAKEIEPFPHTASPATLSVVDLLGNGTSCIVWSSSLPADSHAPMRYIDLMGGKKPYLMKKYLNHAGKEVSLSYKNSVFYYLEDKKKGTPWLTKLPFPVHCVASQTVKDLVTNTEYSSYYTYHHGYYDHEEREFRGFGRVETLDSEKIQMSYNGQGDINEPPIYTKTWYHTGAWLIDRYLLAGYKKEYFKPETYNNNTFVEKDLVQDPVDSSWTAIEQREAYRALKGSALRTEVYSLDGSPKEHLPYSCTEVKYQIQCLQHRAPRDSGAFEFRQFAVFLVTESESIAYHYERNPADPRVAQQLNIDIDLYGNVLAQASVVYPRIAPTASTPNVVQAEQLKLHIVYTQNDFTNDILVPNGAYRLRIGYRTQSYELTGASPAQGYFSRAALQNAFATAATIPYEQAPSTGLQKRCIEAQEVEYLKNDTTAPLPLGTIESRALPYQTYRQAYTQGLFNTVLGAHCTPADLIATGKYVPRGTGYWIPSGTVQYFANPQNTFYAPQRYLDPFGGFVKLEYYSDYFLLMTATEDALGSRTEVLLYDFRLLQPIQMRDANLNISEMAYDLLGMPVGMSLKGKGTEGDQLTGFVADLTTAQKNSFFANPRAQVVSLLGNATARYIYDYESLPLRVATILREEHQAVDPANTRRQIALEYSDGLGRLLMKKVQAEAGEAKTVQNGQLTLVQTTDRWVGTGRTILNNKSKPIRQYEPYFSASSAYETEAQLVAIGYSPTLYYDPQGRVVRTDMPDGTYSYTTFDAWEQTVYDAADTVANSAWYAQMSSGTPEEQDAAAKSLAHADTPTTIYTDSLSRAIYTRQRLTPTVFINTYTQLDIEGNPRTIIDPRGLTQLTYQYDMLGHVIFQESMDTGKAWMLHDAYGKPVYSCDALGRETRISYDILHRPLHTQVNVGGTTLETQRILYGEGQPNDTALNLRGKAYETCDGSGRSRAVVYDFRGNVLSAETELLQDGTQTDTDWRSNPALSGEVFRTQTTYDALNRPKTQTDPDGNTHKYEYSESGALKTSQLITASTSNTIVQDIKHNAKGQREAIWYGNGTKTSYEYHEKNYRVQRIYTVNLSTNDMVQDLRYTYDAVGNITTVQDEAQQTVFFNNTMIQPRQEYTYDALYRLVEAKGREKIGIATQGEDRWDDMPWMGEWMPHADPNQLQNYTQTYTYDEAGNMLQLQHQAPNGGYTRDYTIHSTNNQLLSTHIGSDTYSHSYDVLGNMLTMAHLNAMDYNLENSLAHIQRGTDEAFYQYRSGQRSRKIVQKQGGITEERIYLGSFEIYRIFAGSSLTLERKTVHISDDTGRIGMYEYRTQGNDNSPQELLRYVYSNHLQSSMLELDDQGQIISYEEYHPFGTTAYQATNAQINAVAKRYKYTGKERDEESGLYYHGARYYIPWLARWTQCDPIGIKDGLNVYAYCSNNPVMLNDPSGMSGEDGKKKPLKVVKPPETAQLGSDHAASLNSARNFRHKAQQVVNNKPVKSKDTQEREKAVAEHQKKQQAIVSSASSKIQQERNEEVAFQQQIANNMQAMSVRDPFAYQMAQSPGVQIGMSVAVPGYATTMGAIQLAQGVQNDNKVDIALGAAGMVLGTGVKVPKASGTPMFNNTTFGGLGSGQMANQAFTTALKTESSVSLLNTSFVYKAASEPVVGGGAKLNNIGEYFQQNIQSMADKWNIKIAVVGSRARGEANTLSDWDYIIEGDIQSKMMRDLMKNLPKSRFETIELGKPRLEIFNQQTHPLRTNEPYIQFTPRR